MYIFHNFPFYLYWRKRELHVLNYLSICNDFHQQKDRDVRPVSINRRGHFTCFKPSSLPLLIEKGNACPKLTFFCNSFCQQEDRNIRPVPFNRMGQWTPFTTFQFTPNGRKGNCTSTINILFVITFVSRKIEM